MSKITPKHETSRKELKREINELRGELEQIKNRRTGQEKEETRDKANTSEISRRNFLKKAGIGAAGIGAASLIPSTAALNIESKNPLKYNRKFSVSSNGKLETNHVNINKLSLGGDGPATSFEEMGQGKASRFDAILYREDVNSGDYVGYVRRTDNRYSHSSDAGEVLQSVHDDLDSINFNSKGGIGSVAIQPNHYTFESTATITERGFGLHGLATFQQTRGSSGPVFRDGGVGDQNALVHVKDTKGFVARGIYINLGNNSNAYGIHIDNTDACTIHNVNSIDNMDSGGRPFRAYGSYETIMSNCFLHQLELEENTEKTKNINNWRIMHCNFTSANPDVPPAKLAAGGNDVIDCTFNQDLADGTLNDGVPGIATSDNGAGFQRYQFLRCRWIGQDGDPMFENQGRIDFFNCFISGGGGPLFEKLVGCRLIGCRIAPAHEIIKSTDNNRSISSFLMVNNRITGANGESGVAAIDIDGTQKNKNFFIANNFFENMNGDHDILFRSKNPFDQGATIVNNKFNQGLSLPNFGVGAMQGPESPKVAGNQKYNPVRASRPTPNLPSSTGSNNKVGNDNPQPVHIYMSGGTEPYDPTIEDHTGSTVDLTGSPKKIKLDRFGRIYFRSNVPGNWTWYWE